MLGKGKIRVVVLSLTVGAGVLTATRAARAALTAYDPFNQTATTNINGTASTSPGVWPSASNWTSSGNVAVVNSNLGYTDSTTSRSLSSTGNAAQLNADSAAAFRTLSTTTNAYGGAGSDFWISFTFNAAGATGSTANTGLSLFTGTSTEHIFIGDRNGKFGFGDYAKAAGNATLTGVAADSNVHFIAMHFQLTGTGTSTDTYYLDPTGLGMGIAPTSQAAIVQSTASNPFNFDTIRIGRFTAGTAGQIDEIRFGDTWQDVSPTPEPASLGLLGAAALGLLARRRARGARGSRLA